jgi:hypothetical protein
MNFSRFGYAFICLLALVYLVMANARGYVPFTGAYQRGGGGRSGGGHGYIFHK